MMLGSDQILLPVAANEFLAELGELSDDLDRLKYLRAHEELRVQSVVDLLADEVVRLVRVDLNKADLFAETALWLAEELDDEYCRGRGQRAAANVAHFKGELAPAARLYEAALNCFKRAGNRKEIANTCMSGLGNLVFLGEYQQAFEWADVAKEIFESQQDHLRLARLDLNVATILFRQDRWEEAAKRYENAYKVFQQLGESEDVAISLRNMAVCHQSLNNYRQALDLYRDARRTCQENNLPLLIAELDYNIAYLYYLRGDYTRAIELYRETRDLCEDIGERYHMALCDLDQAEIFVELNLIEEAVELAQRAFTAFDELGMPYETAKSLTNLAIAVNRQGKAFLTLDLFSKTRKIFVNEENKVWPALIDLNQAVVMYNAGRPLEAARLALRAHRGFSDTALPTKIAMCDALLARLNLESGDLASAREKCSAALGRLRPGDLPVLQYHAYFILGEIEEAEGHRDAALEAYRKAQESLERMRRHLHTKELKVDFREDKLLVYESLVSLILSGESSAEDRLAVFNYFEKAKTRSLADLMAFRAHTLQSTKPTRSDQAVMVRTLREELNWYYRQIDLQEMRGDDQSREEISQLREFSRMRENHLIRKLRELQAADQEFSSLQEAATVDIETIRSVLPEDTLLLEYYIARGTVYACVLDRYRLEIAPVTVATRVRELLRLLQFQFSKFAFGQDYVEEFLEVINEATDSSLQELFSELIGPIRSLMDKRHLVIVPHGFLHYVPFHALLDGNRFLIDDFTISYSPSASVYYFSCNKRVSSENRSIVFGVSEPERLEILEEAETAAKVLPDVQLFVGKDANEENLRIHGGSSRIVYIASRSHFRQDNPMFSSIELGDSRLNLFDLYNLRFLAELVVLSGCGTTAGGEGDEFVGMTRGLLYAGAQSVLVELWQADARSRALFMPTFLSAITTGSSRSTALKEAMLAVRKIYPHPYYWAPCVLVGKPAGETG